ncbi:MAG: hypothetical protein HGA19_19035 [Oscillochloris sp.]|nr:hypothetical protein [Oscillochloris sp.]
MPNCGSWPIDLGCRLTCAATNLRPASGGIAFEDLGWPLALVFAAGVGGTLIPGAIVAATGSFETGIMSVVVGALLASVVMFALAQVLHY